MQFLFAWKFVSPVRTASKLSVTFTSESGIRNKNYEEVHYQECHCISIPSMHSQLSLASTFASESGIRNYYDEQAQNFKIVSIPNTHSQLSLASTFASESGIRNFIFYFRRTHIMMSKYQSPIRIANSRWLALSQAKVG